MRTPFEVRPRAQSVHLSNPSWASPPAVDKLPDWRWMQAVYVRTHEIPGCARISWVPNPKDWTPLPLAHLDPQDIDLFESTVAVPPPCTILPYPLRVLSLPRESIRIGDRRMIRKRPGHTDQFDVCVVCRQPTDDDEFADIELDIGGGCQVHTIAIHKARLRTLLREHVFDKKPTMLRFVLKNIALEPAPDHTLQSRFDAYLREISDPLSWFQEHVEQHSGEIPEMRIAAMNDDDKRIRDWLKDIERATHQRRPPSALGDDEDLRNERYDDYDRAAE